MKLSVSAGWMESAKVWIALAMSFDSPPRQKRSVWSEVNIKRVAVLLAEGRVETAGMRAFQARRENRSGIYSYEQRRDRLPEPYQAKLKKTEAAWSFFQSTTDIPATDRMVDNQRKKRRDPAEALAKGNRKLRPW